MAKKRGQNEGTIRQRKDGSWEARYTIGVDANGKQKQKSIYGKTRKEVAEKLIQVTNEINNGTYSEPTKLMVKEWLNTWLWEYKKDSIKPTSFTRYEICVRVHVVQAIGNIILKDLKPYHIQGLINSKKNENQSARSIKYIYTALHNALDLAVKNGLIAVNPCKAVVLPKQDKKEIKVLTCEEQTKFIQSIKGHKLETAFILDLFTGLRLSELLALKWSNIDFKKGILKVSGNIQRINTYEKEGNKTKIIFQNSTKTKAGQRTIPLLEEILSILKKHKKIQSEEKLKAGMLYIDNDLVFANELGGIIEPRRMTNIFNKALKKADIQKINFHALRHTFATRGLENGINPKVMQEILGHTRITMTLDLYSHVLPDTKKRSYGKIKRYI